MEKWCGGGDCASGKGQFLEKRKEKEKEKCLSKKIGYWKGKLWKLESRQCRVSLDDDDIGQSQPGPLNGWVACR